MSVELKSEIEANYDFFQRNLGKFLKTHRGQFALLHNRRVEGYFARPSDAYRRGLALYSDGNFSIQEVDEQPAEMGLISLALD